MLSCDHRAFFVKSGPESRVDPRQTEKIGVLWIWISRAIGSVVDGCVENVHARRLKDFVEGVGG